MIEGLYEKVEGTVKKVAQETHIRWARIMPADDIEQELWLYILEHPSTQEWMLTAKSSTMKSILAKQGDYICSKERLDYDHFTGNYNYNSQEVGALLEGLVGGKSIKPDMAVDLQLGMEDLQKEHPQFFETLHDIYWERLDYSDTPKRKRKSRALSKLAELMNRKRSQREAERTEGPGTKPKITKEDY